MARSVYGISLTCIDVIVLSSPSEEAVRGLSYCVIDRYGPYLCLEVLDILASLSFCRVHWAIALDE